MPDLGPYAFEVGLAYAGSIAILVFLVGLSIWQSRRAKTAPDEAEDRATDA